MPRPVPVRLVIARALDARGLAPARAEGRLGRLG